MLDTLISLSKDVNKKIETDQKVRDMANEKDRIIVLHFSDEKDYILEVKDGKLLEPREGTVEEPTLLVATDTGTMKKILDKKLNPLMAYAMKKIKVKGPMEEVVLLKEFF
jgi:putative sterol carrier protein